jgi:hypothetical protein
MSAKLHMMRLDLPGLWSDGWLYKEHLILWARDGRMHVLPLSDIVSRLRDLDDPPLEVVADFLLFRNDWKTSEQFGRLFSLRGIEESFTANFPSATGEIVLQLDEATPVSIKSDQIPGVILDSAIYDNRVYIGSTLGLFETRFDPDNPMRMNHLVDRMSKRVSTVTAGYSAVNGSAGESGLWFGRMNRDSEPWWRDRSSFKLVADYSRGNSFADVNLLNYTDEAFPGFLRSETVKEPSRDRSVREDRRITGYRESANIAALTTSALTSSRKAKQGTPDFGLDIDGEAVEVLGNSGKRLLVAWNESLRVVDLSLQHNRDLSVKSNKSYQGIADLEIDPYAILDTHAFGNGKSFLVELSNEVRLINSQGSFTLISEPVARIRTFARSRRYREVALLVRETGVSLIGMYIAQEPESPDRR